MGFPQIVIVIFVALLLLITLYKKREPFDIYSLPKYDPSTYNLSNNILTAFIDSNKAILNKFGITLITVLMIYFLFLSVLPGNERVLDFALAANDNNQYTCAYGGSCEYVGDCDDPIYGQSGDTCTDCTYWNTGGSGDSQGYPIGGATLCCGDDDAEYYNYFQVDEAVMENSQTDNASDAACCEFSSSCVLSLSCYAEGYSSSDVDGDTDDDYCELGGWKDCITDDDCQSGQVCSVPLNDCISVDYGYIIIRNLGLTGFEQTNPEYTSTRTVYLDLNFTVNATECRYINHDNDQQQPPTDSVNWTYWEPCVVSRIWQLSEYPGLKTVYYEINYSSFSVMLNDSIYYNFTGTGLDVTPPNPPTIIDGDYTNNNESITISWYNASDPESEILGIPLQYEYVLYLSDGTILDNVMTSDTSVTSTGLNLAHNSVVYANVTVINSAGLTAKSTSDGLIIDLEKPYITSLEGSYQNVTTNNYFDLPGVPDWIYTYITNFSWTGFDDVTTSVDAYSYVLTTDSSTNPDNVPEGQIGSFDTETSTTLSNLASAQYYFKVRTRDLAGNWGDANSIQFWVDNTPPTQPEILSESRTDGNITYTWSQSTDSESGIDLYMINLTNATGHTVDYAIITDLGNRIHTFEDVASGDYNASVGAKNGVDIWRWSGIEEALIDFTPPIIIATPNRTVIVNSPILKAWTNEPATCYYNISTGNVKFVYSNTTYHETKVYSLINGDHSYKITCSDIYGNSDSVNIYFTIDTTSEHNNIEGPGSLDTYEDITTTFSVHILDVATELVGLLGDRFTLTLNGDDQELSVFDRGTGYYNVSFVAPDPGSYNLRLEVDSGTNITFTLNVLDLYVSSSYSESGITPDDTDHITYYTTSEARIGLASDTEYLAINSVNNILNISSIKLEDNLFVFNTKPSISMTSRERLMDDQSFLQLVNPSFGHQIDKTYIINYILRYDAFLIQSEIGDTLTSGRYNVLTRHTISSTGERIIKLVQPRSG